MRSFFFWKNNVRSIKSPWVHVLASIDWEIKSGTLTKLVVLYCDIESLMCEIDVALEYVGPTHQWLNVTGMSREYHGAISLNLLPCFIWISWNINLFLDKLVLLSKRKLVGVPKQLLLVIRLKQVFNETSFTDQGIQATPIRNNVFASMQRQLQRSQARIKIPVYWYMGRSYSVVRGCKCTPKK